MKENYLINIQGTVEQEGETDSIQLMTRGSFMHRNGSFFISYKETEATGFEGNITTVRVDEKDKVSMLRFGNAPSQLIIELGRRHVCHYESGYGSLSMGVAASEIDNALHEKGGQLMFSYTLDTDSVQISHHRVKISVTDVTSTQETRDAQ